jgi:hypothetical protein
MYSRPLNRIMNDETRVSLRSQSHQLYNGNPVGPVSGQESNPAGLEGYPAGDPAGA